MQEKLSALQKSIFEKDHRIQELIESDMSKNSKHEEDVKILKEKLSDFESKYEALETELKSYREKRSQHDKNIENDKAKIKELEKYIDQLKADNLKEMQNLGVKLTEENDKNLETLKQKAELKLASLKVIFSL